MWKLGCSRRADQMKTAEPAGWPGSGLDTGSEYHAQVRLGVCDMCERSWSVDETKFHMKHSYRTLCVKGTWNAVDDRHLTISLTNWCKRPKFEALSLEDSLLANLNWQMTHDSVRSIHLVISCSVPVTDLICQTFSPEKNAILVKFIWFYLVLAVI